MQKLGSTSMLHQRSCKPAQSALLTSSSVALAPAFSAGAPNLSQYRAKWKGVSNHTKTLFSLNSQKYINFHSQQCSEHQKTMSCCAFIICKEKKFQRSFDIFLKTLDSDFSKLLFETPLTVRSQKNTLVFANLVSAQPNKSNNQTAIKCKEEAIFKMQKSGRFHFLRFQQIPTQFQNSRSSEKDMQILVFNFLKLYHTTQKTFGLFFENFFSINAIPPVCATKECVRSLYGLRLYDSSLRR